jgi:hypothetical protein
MIDLSDVMCGLDQLAKIPELARTACDLSEAGKIGESEQKLKEALVIGANSQAFLMLNLAKLALQRGDFGLGWSYCETALDELEMVGTEDGAIGKAALLTLRALGRTYKTHVSPAAGKAGKNRKRKR